jgi:hypothetical protein
VKIGLERVKLKTSTVIAVSREQLLKALEAGDDLEFAAVICKVWRLAVTL